MNEVADALRNVTAAIQRELDAGRRSTRIDANDLVEVLLAVADALDPPFGPTPGDKPPPKAPRRRR